MARLTSLQFTPMPKATAFVHPTLWGPVQVLVIHCGDLSQVPTMHEQYFCQRMEQKRH